MVYIYYKLINKTGWCDRCNKEDRMRYKVVRVVFPGQASYVAGYNCTADFFCCKKCMKEHYYCYWDNIKFVKVRFNTIKEINDMGYPA